MIENILSYLLLDEDSLAIQRIQTQHRLNLADFWHISDGQKILEIGCGQGDTTAVLADLVGPSGEVVAIDIASPDYGSPYTLGEATQVIKESAIGSRINFLLETDILQPEVSFPENYFDKIVLSHCSWYFKDHHQFEELIEKIKPYTKEICYAEWSIEVSEPEQLAHLYAVLVQNHYQIFSENAEANVRTLITPTDLAGIMRKQELALSTETALNDPDLQDASWEISFVNFHLKTQIIHDEELNQKTKELLLSQISEMNRLAAIRITPLNIYASTWQVN